MKSRLLLSLAALLLISTSVVAQNPIIRDQFSADPSALVVGDRVFVFPSHDIPAPDDYPRKDWFCMADYHVFSSSDLINWTDHGKIVDQKEVPWVNETSYSMWAPDCAQHANGKFYFYFPSSMKVTEGVRFGGNRVGVAIAENPEGPYVAQSTPVEGVNGIDPCVFVDDDGQGYLVMPGITITKLNDDWLSVDRTQQHRVEGVPTKGLVEGPYLFKANGYYYMTFPWAREDTEVLAYCMSENLFGPYEFKGVFFEEWENKCWTNHHSVINFKDQWYLFYHHNDYSPSFDKNRAVCADSLFFNADGTIETVNPTLRGIGITPAQSEIQLDRYSEISQTGDSIDYLNYDNYFEGWKTIFFNQGAWAKYNTVQFDKAAKKVTVKAMSPNGGVLRIYQGDKVVSEVKIPKSSDWTETTAKVKKSMKGIHHVKVQLVGNDEVQVDWLSFQ